MGQFSNLISTGLLSLHEECLDDLISSDIGESCKIFYPPKWVDCVSCAVDVIGNKPSTININGRPIPISPSNKCTFCGGQGKIQQEVIETIRGLIYWRVQDSTRWGRLKDTEIQIADNYIELISDKTNIHKILSSNFIEVATRHQPSKIYRYKLDSEPEPLGFRGKYIICLLRKAG